MKTTLATILDIFLKIPVANQPEWQKKRQEFYLNPPLCFFVIIVIPACRIFLKPHFVKGGID